ncbi:alpha/beta-hydrolase [Lentinus tigrinus ALCF2SS1-7]|uniref:Alpha/beta-hydrolase n=1 Tax=Lentinus tigrinus ALCF2SS1-6 TaxID=1328759 RepID=A0A5C2SL29_9APHY|nr:alpha/beta-hydrolase [Lentinus tigrinus ALCF2SS1-6]RPD76653.1 alpha/beta-hydrolase [Lentinus tigrinus ALCF2SS1-7]
MTNLLNYQPLKGLYLVYFVSSLIFVKVPFWFVRYLPPSLRPRPAWTLKRAMIVRAFQELFSMKIQPKSKKRDLLAEVPDNSLVDAKFVWVEPVPDELFTGEIRRAAEITGVQRAKIAGFWLLKTGSSWSGPKASPGERTLLHLHGGAFHIGTANPSDVTANFTRGLLECSQSLQRTFAVDYRLTASAPNPPENPFPAALLDALAAYRYLVQDAGFAPENIIIAGDSAGANLAVTLTLHLIENPVNTLPPPGRVLTASAWLDLSSSRRGPESSAVLNAPTDIFFVRPGKIFAEYAVTSIRGPLDFEFVKTNRYLSPVSPECDGAEGLFEGFPETYVTAGGAERLLDDSKVFVEKLRADGVKVTEDFPPDAVHDFVVFRWHEPERTEVLKRVSKWIDGV